MTWTTLQVREARSRTSSYAGVSRHGLRLVSDGGTLTCIHVTRNSRCRTTKLRRVGHELTLRLKYVRFVAVLEAT